MAKKRVGDGDSPVVSAFANGPDRSKTERLCRVCCAVCFTLQEQDINVSDEESFGIRS